MRKTSISIFIISLFFALQISAQAVHEKGTPISFKEGNNLKNSSELPVERMPELDYKTLIEEDKKDNEAGMAPRFGYLHQVKYNLNNSGTWENLPNGDRVWRLTIFAPNARTINLNYSRYNVPRGGKLFIYNNDRTDVLGPFTKKNEKTTGGFATGFTKGEECVIEYFEPADAKGKSDIEISGIVNGYKSLNNFVDDFLKAFGTSGGCNNDVNCAMGAGWENQIKSVGLHILANGTRWCSGALINTTAGDCRPYFLTANHCISSPVGTTLNDMFMFNYDSPTPACPGTPTTDGPTNQIITTGTIIAKASDSDFCLFDLSSNPLDFYDVYYSGWDRSNTSASSVTGIHHPDGDVKKISFEDDPVESTDYFGTTIIPNQTHWRVPDWDAGTTEPGSSGSPLFDQANKRIIGQLHGGNAACSGSTNNGTADWYGKVWYSWDQNGGANTVRLEPWLDPSSTGVMFINGDDCSTPMPPIASFNPVDMSSYAFCNGGDIQFNDASMGIPTGWSWSFSGAGVSPTTSTSQNPLVNVTTSGTLTATLTVTNALGTDSKTQTYNVIVSNCNIQTTCDSPGLSIPDDDPTGVSSDIIITSTGAITDLDIDLDITHTYIGDLTVIISFNGTSVTLVDEPFCTSNNIVDVTFDDSSTNGTFSSNGCSGGTNSSPAFTGTYNPSQPLSAFNGMDQAGTWTITVIDGAGLDTGTLDDWCLTLETVASSLPCYSMLDNTTLPVIETGVKDYESSDWIYSTSILQSGAQIDYDGVDSLMFDIGFEVQLGAAMEAFLDGCNNGNGGANLTGDAQDDVEKKKEDLKGQKISKDNEGDPK